MAVKATVDPRVLLGVVPAEEADSCLQQADVDIKVGGNLSKAEKDKILEMAHRSPVHALVKGANSISERIV